MRVLDRFYDSDRLHFWTARRSSPALSLWHLSRRFQGQLCTLASYMDAAQTIRDAVARVTSLRLEAASAPDLHSATVAIKSFQAQRFAGTYADLLASTEYAGAARFFLEDLYSDKDYSLRDSQFARIAGALQTLFPQPVVETAVSLARLHVLTEELDRQMAIAWEAAREEKPVEPVRRYMHCWALVGREEDRYRQLEMVLRVGKELDHLTGKPGLRLMLRMMRRPAMAAGLGSLQSFLEAGFDTFAKMAGKGSCAQQFLDTIRDRESTWIRRLYGSNLASCETALRACLSKAQ